MNNAMTMKQLVEFERDADARKLREVFASLKREVEVTLPVIVERTNNIRRDHVQSITNDIQEIMQIVASLTRNRELLENIEKLEVLK